MFDDILDMTVAQVVENLRYNSPEKEIALGDVLAHKEAHPYEWIAEQLDLWKNKGDLDAYQKFTDYHEKLQSLEMVVSDIMDRRESPNNMELISSWIKIGSEVLGVGFDDGIVLSTVITDSDDGQDFSSSTRKRRGGNAVATEPIDKEVPVITPDDYIGFRENEFLGQRLLYARFYAGDRKGYSVPLLGWVQDKAVASGMYTKEQIDLMKANDSFRGELLKLPTNIVYRVAYGLISGVWGAKNEQDEYNPDSIAICSHEVGYRDFKVCRLVTRCTEGDGCVWVITEGGGIQKEVALYPKVPDGLSESDAEYFNEFVKAHNGFGASGCKGKPYFPPALL